MPFLIKAKTIENDFPNRYPFTVPVIESGFEINFKSNVTFLVGENGSGKSTILEAIADLIGFNLSGGTKHSNYKFKNTESDLSAFMRLTWKSKVSNGFFMRAESFFNFASYMDILAEENKDIDIYAAYGGKSLHHQSHGESFLALFQNLSSKGIYILDEPEAALSPQRQLTFLAIINELEKSGNAQFIIATHSPILLSYPNATVLNLDNNLEEIDYKETEHFKLTRSFLNNPDSYFRHLFEQ
jgi:predicted ATPase